MQSTLCEPSVSTIQAQIYRYSTPTEINNNHLALDDPQPNRLWSSALEVLQLHISLAADLICDLLSALAVNRRDSVAVTRDDCRLAIAVLALRLAVPSKTIINGTVKEIKLQAAILGLLLLDTGEAESARERSVGCVWEGEEKRAAAGPGRWHVEGEDGAVAWRDGWGILSAVGSIWRLW